MHCIFFIDTPEGCVVVMGSTIDSTKYDTRLVCNTWGEMVSVYTKLHSEYMDNGTFQYTARELRTIATKYRR